MVMIEELSTERECNKMPELSGKAKSSGTEKYMFKQRGNRNTALLDTLPDIKFS